MRSFHRLNATRLCASAAPLALLMGLSSPAFAQNAPASVSPGDQAAEGEAPDIVVTGSLFRRTDTETPSPVTVLTADSLAKAGITTAAEAIRSVSADSGGSIGVGFQSGFSAGGVAVSLRGLGVSSTLVLVDGLRSTNFPINDDGHNAYVDLNSIPFSLIERVEVLKDGASSTYGADAIGGVVNLIMKKQFTGIAGTVEAGASEKGDAGRQRANLTIGYGDYAEKGFNVYLNGEFQQDGRVSAHSRGFPYNNRDLTSIGGADNNGADNSLTTPTPHAVVVRTNQTNLNNPLAGGTAVLTTQYQTLGLASCAGGTYTQVSATVNGVGCKHNIEDEYFQLAPLQRKYSINGRLSVRLADNIEGYVTGSYSNSYVSILNAPRALRNTQPYGGAPALASSNPGIVLPVYICTSGVDCATPGAPGRQLNPNNPYASAFAADPANGAARIYYLFGDIKAGSDRTNEVYRFAAGLNGTIGDDWTWKIDGVYARDNLEIVQHGYLNIANTLKAINTGSYNFVNPSLNSQAVRDSIAPDKITPSFSEMYSVDAAITKQLLELPGGPLMFAIGGQVRHETLENNNQNAALDTYSLTTSSAFGEHTVTAGYFEIAAPVLDILEINGSGRYDHYSEGFGRFSPKIGFKLTPIKQIAFRGTYSQGFRAPTFAESGPRSQYAGFVTKAPPCNFVLAHNGTGTLASCSANGNPYNLSYSVGRGFVGNPNLKPETSRSFTAGAIFEPVPWLSMTVDYYNVKKSNLIANGPDAGKAIDAYFTKTNLADATAAVAAIGPGYSVNTVDAIDPQAPGALPRILIINAPFVNVNYDLTSGLDFSATARVPLGDGIRFTSRVEATYVIQYDRSTSSGIQRFAGTLGPYDLSSGNGTPRIRGNWQNTLDVGKFSLSATAYYVGRIKEVATDQGNLSLACSANLYKTPTDGTGNSFCYVNSFINVDLNAKVEVNDQFSFFANVGNVLGARAPIAPASYASSPNFLTTWHYAGLIGRTFRAGANFKF